jgi:hypothetical protein
VEPSPEGVPVPTGTVEELIAAASAHFEAAQAAQRAGDWALYGQEQEALGQVLRQLQALTGALAPEATPEATAEP